LANLFDTTNAATTEPEMIVAGDRLIWKRIDLNADYANSAYTLKYSARLEGTGSTEIEITAAEPVAPRTPSGNRRTSGPGMTSSSGCRHGWDHLS